MDKPKITLLQIIYDFQVETTGGGVSRFAIDLCRNLNLEQFNVYLCGLGYAGTENENHYIEELNNTGVKAFTAAQWDHHKPYKSFLKAVRSLISFSRGHAIDIVHSHSEFGDMAALALHFFGRAPRLLRTVHYGYQVEWRNRPFRRLLLTNLLYPLIFDTEIGVSPQVVRNLERRPLARRLKKSAVYINNAVDLNRFTRPAITKAEIRTKKGLPPDRLIIGSVGRLTEQKGYTYFIAAARQVIDKVPQGYFIVVGDGELRTELEDEIRAAELEDHVHLLGSREDIEEILIAMDLFVSSSLWEGLPTVIMESMAAGIPVVATDIPGTRDLIQDGLSGWLARPADPGHLAQVILTALDSADQRLKFAQQAQLEVRKYSIQDVADRHTALYKEIMGTAVPE